MAARERLPNRREAETFAVEAGGLRYRATVGQYADGRVAEIFLVNHKAGSQAGIMASDAAVVASITLQSLANVAFLAHAIRFAVHESSPSSVFLCNSRQISRLALARFSGSVGEMFAIPVAIVVLWVASLSAQVGVVWPNYASEKAKSEPAEKGASEEKSEKGKSLQPKKSSSESRPRGADQSSPAAAPKEKRTNTRSDQYGALR